MQERGVGLRKLEEGYAEPGAETAFGWVAVAPDGSAAASGALRGPLPLFFS